MFRSNFIQSLVILVFLLLTTGCPQRGGGSGGKVEPDPEPKKEKLYKIAGCDVADRDIDIVFLHGVDGSYKATWHPEGKPGDFWPQWVYDDLAESGIKAGVWSMDYPASTTSWSGETMALIDRARNVLTHLEGEGFEEDANRPLVFVCHSFGGLVAKQLIRTAKDSPSEDWNKIYSRTEGVVLIGVPNKGSSLANFAEFVLNRLTRLNLTTVTVTELKKSPFLLDLNRWYINNAPELGISTLVFCEKEPVKIPLLGGVVVVDESSGDPGVKGIEPHVLGKDHVEICKPLDKDEPIHKLTMKLIRKLSKDQILLHSDKPKPADQADQKACPENQIPTMEQVKKKPNVNPSDVFLECRNNTNRDIEIALYDWSRHYDNKRGKWRFFKMEAHDTVFRFEDFQDDSTGWFSIYVVAKNGVFSKCLGTINLFTTLHSEIVISHQGGLKAQCEILD